MEEQIQSILRDILEELRAIRTQERLEAKPFLTIAEVAEKLHMAPKTIRNKFSAGTFEPRPTRIGGKVLFRAADVQRLGM